MHGGHGPRDVFEVPDAARAYFRDAAVLAAHDLGLFDALAAGDLAALGVSPARLRPLVDALVLLGAARRDGTRVLPPDVIPPRPEHVTRAGWGRLAEVLRSGVPLDAPDVAAHHEHLAWAGHGAARSLAGELGARGRRRLLDAGGGTGAYTAAFLEAHPEARATLVDLPPIVALARVALARFGSRVTFLSADLREAELPAGHDVALMANLLHHFPAEVCARLVARVASSVDAGGEVVVKDLQRDSDEGVLFALNMVLYTEAGDVHEDAAIRVWLEDAGVVDVRLEGEVRRGRRADVPAAFAATLTRALAIETPGSEHAGALRRHYYSFLPGQRAEQLARPLFNLALDWSRLPRLTAAMARLGHVLDEADVPRPEVLGPAPTLRAVYERSYYGGLMPLLYGSPADLAHVESLVASGAEPHAVIDRWLAAPLVHEMSHLARPRPALPMHLDECLAGWLGVRALPELAYPAPGEANALYAAPWLAQVGQAIARALGVGRALRCHAGIDPWPERFAAGAEALYWSSYRERKPLHFLCDAFDPGPWLDLVERTLPLEDDPDFDRLIVEDGLRAMCLDNRLEDGRFVVRAAPPAGPVTIDLEARRIGAPVRPGSLDRVAPSYPIPRRVAARKAGPRRFTLEIAAVDQIALLAGEILA